MATVATAEVRIIADTSRFVPDLRRKLRAAFATLGNQLGDDIVQRIDRRVSQRLTTVMNQAARRAGQTFSESFDRALTDSGLSEALRDQLGGAASRRGARQAGENVADNFTDAFTTNLGDLRNGIFQALAASDIDTDAFFAGQRSGIQFSDGVAESLQDRLGRQMREAFEEAEDSGIPRIFRRMGNTFAAELVDEIDDSLTATLGRVFQRLGNREADEAGGRTGTRFGRAFANALRSLPGTLQQVLNAVAIQPLAGLTSVLGEMSSEMLSVIGEALALVALLEALSGLLFALPAITNLAAAGIAAIIVPLLGTRDAFSEAFGEAENFEDALEGLTDPAKSVARELRAIAPALRDLRLPAQAAFFTEIEGAITEVADNLLGRLSEGLESAAGGFGRIVDQIGEFLAQTETAATVGAVFQTLTGIFDALAASTQPFLEGMRNLVDEFLPRIAELEGPLSRIGDAFRDWTEEIIESGAAMDAFDRGLDTLDEIFSITRDISGIFESMFDAAESEGVDALGAVADAISDIRQEFASLEGQEVLGDVFDSLGRIATVVGRVFRTLFDNLAELAPDIADLFEEVGPPIEDLIDGLAEGFRELLDSGGTEFFRDLAEALAGVDWASVGQRIGELLGNIGPFLEDIEVGLDVVIGVINFVIDLFEFLNDLFGGTSNSDWMDSIRQFFEDLLNLDSAQEWIEDTDQAIADFFQEKMPILIEAGLELVKDEFDEWWEEVKEDWNEFWTDVGDDAVIGMEGLLGAVAGGLLPVSQSTEEWQGGFGLSWSTFWDGLSQVTATVLSGIGTTIVNSFAGFSGTIAGWSRDARAVWNAFWLNLVITTQTNLANAGARIFSGLANMRNTITGWISGIRALWSTFWSGLGSTVSNGLSNVSTRISNALRGATAVFTVFVANVRNVLNGLINFMLGIASSIQGIFSRISGYVSSALSAASSLGNIDLNPFADGGVVYGPTAALIGEAGPEVVIPLTRPQRAVDLVQQSGLLGLLAAQGVIAGAPTPAPTSGRAAEIHVHTNNTDAEQVARKALRLLERRMGGRGLERLT